MKMRMSVIATMALSIALCASPAAFAQQGGKPGSQPSPLALNSASRAQPQWYTQQGNEMRASKLIGATVVNDAKESVGKINELVLSKNGKLAAVVIGVGGAFSAWGSATSRSTSIRCA